MHSGRRTLIPLCHYRTVDSTLEHFPCVRRPAVQLHGARLCLRNNRRAIFPRRAISPSQGSSPECSCCSCKWQMAESSGPGSQGLNVKPNAQYWPPATPLGDLQCLVAMMKPSSTQLSAPIVAARWAAWEHFHKAVLARHRSYKRAQRRGE